MLEGDIKGLDGLLWDVSSTVSSAPMHKTLKISRSALQIASFFLRFHCLKTGTAAGGQ
jgi:hypothetical protein